MPYLPMGPGRLSPAREAMIDDAMLIAAHIVRDMGAAFPKTGRFWANYLGERFGDYGWADLRRRHAYGVFNSESETIQIDYRLINSPRMESTLRHEIAHKLALASGRYDDLESPHFASYDPRAFHEMIAEWVAAAYRHPPIYECLLELYELWLPTEVVTD